MGTEINSSDTLSGDLPRINVSGLKSPTPRVLFVYISYLVFFLLGLAVLAMDYYILSLYSNTGEETINSSLVHFVDFWEKPLNIANFLFYILSFTAFLLWAYRVAKNTLVMKPGKHYFTSPARHIWSYFIPIICLYVPYKGMKDILGTSCSILTGQNTTKSKIVGTWWILFWASIFVSRISTASEKHISAMNEKDITPEMYAEVLKIFITADIIDLAGIIATICMVYKITQRQKEIIKGSLSLS